MAAKKDSAKRKDPLSALLSTWQSITAQLPAGMNQVGDAVSAATETVAKAAADASKDVLPPMPGQIAAAQFNVVATALASQRESLRAMQKQLGAFDEQLNMLEKMLKPMVAWSGNWAQMEHSISTPMASAARVATRAAEDTLAAASSAAATAASMVTDYTPNPFAGLVDLPNGPATKPAKSTKPAEKPAAEKAASAGEAPAAAPQKAAPRKSTARKTATKSTARKTTKAAATSTTKRAAAKKSPTKASATKIAEATSSGAPARKRPTRAAVRRTARKSTGPAEG